MYVVEAIDQKPECNLDWLHQSGVVFKLVWEITHTPLPLPSRLLNRLQILTQGVIPNASIWLHHSIPSLLVAYFNPVFLLRIKPKLASFTFIASYRLMYSTEFHSYWSVGHFELIYIMDDPRSRFLVVYLKILFRHGIILLLLQFWSYTSSF